VFGVEVCASVCHANARGASALAHASIKSGTRRSESRPARRSSKTYDRAWRIDAASHRAIAALRLVSGDMSDAQQARATENGTIDILLEVRRHV
jgi:hypothetical protein